ncbi:RING/U-box superfamily protein [Prunus dulcis]|uniref:RING/U-box superfamily protein n=1 Tax=Prunus dulcis TaxID=3755 RepID=A0A4Y1QNJ3_PRUDU|nr:RING/U-box superfamily protein [Prunus dulcis]
MDNATSPASSSSAVKCSICMDDVSDDCGRTVVRLRCSHSFHLDCIGSAFNVKGVMECPNCREIENGVWRCFENGSPEPDLYEGMDEEPVDFIDMKTCLTTDLEPHIEDADGNFVDPYAVFAGNPNTSHQLNVPPVHSGVFTSQVNWRCDPFICDTCINSFSRGDHTSGANWASVRSATLSAGLDFHAMPNEPFVPRIVERGMLVQIATESPFGLGYQGSNDPVYSNLRRMQQTPTNSSSSAADAYMRRSNGLRGWFPAEYTAPSLVEQTGNSFSWSANLNSNLSEAATHSHHHVQERNAVEPLQLFPEDTGSLLPDINEYA